MGCNARDLDASSYLIILFSKKREKGKKGGGDVAFHYVDYRRLLLYSLAHIPSYIITLEYKKKTIACVSQGEGNRTS